MTEELVFLDFELLNFDLQLVSLQVLRLEEVSR